MWTLDGLDENGCRVLHAGAVAVNLLPGDQEHARDAPNRVAMERVLHDVFAQNKVLGAPPFTYDELDDIRAAVGGAAFQPPPTFTRGK